jgi:hypothetical protein
MIATLRRILVFFVLFTSLVGGVRTARAQGMGGMGGPPGGGMGRPQAPSKAPKAAEPVTHAASGATDEGMQFGGTEPSLPVDPLEVSPEVKKHIGTDAEREIDRGRAPKTERLLIPPYYQEKSGQYSFKTVFPVWLERKQPNDRASLFGILYFNRRSTKHDADVLFPLVWKMRDDDAYTTVVGPFVHREAPKEHDNWVAPLFFSGSREKSGYFHIPPLLTFTAHDNEGGFNLVGPYYCFWKGGSSCSPSHAEDIDYGFAPLFFAGKSPRARYEIAVPFLHYFRYNEVNDSSINIWGPLIFSHSKQTDAFNVFPLYWHSWGKNENHLTVFPFFHTGYEGNSRLFINPLFLTATGENGESTFATWVYARYRGRTSLDMVTPLYWHWEDPDISRSNTLVFPFYYRSTSPRNDDIAVFPLFGHFKRHGLSETTWVTPLVQHTHDIQGWQTNIHPIVYIGRTYESTHTVIAPFFWDFASPHSRTTVGFPFYWRFADEATVSLLAGNTFYHQRKVSGGLDWEVHIFPAFSYGETPDGHWWNVLFGLAGYTRRGSMTQARALWIPMTLTDPAP